MSRLATDRTLRHASRRRVISHHLKCCPLCGGLNAAVNVECFVCRWHGEFIQDPDVLEAALTRLFDDCPELAEAVMDEASHPRLGLLDRLRRFFRRRIDLHA